MKMHRLFC